MIANEVHNNAALAYDLASELSDFSLTIQQRFQQLWDYIESARQSGLLDPENYEQLMNREKFDMAFQDLVEHSCTKLSMGMMNFLEDLAKKMAEYNNIQIT
ncbi:MAG: hypothetical protein WC319_03155 [Candidatus Paceibacterota bacterium]|jgi:hypothetical protein